jgi:predicted nucleic acid-binding protein
MEKKIFSIYADTSVYGGVFDDEFSRASNAFFEQVHLSHFALFVSEVIHKELEVAPKEINELFRQILPLCKLAEISENVLDLQQAYIKEGILSKRWYDDALHVAIATVAQCDIIVSWNFKHIVNFQKIPLFNAVNTLNGYKPIAIYSPMEVIGYGE